MLGCVGLASYFIYNQYYSDSKTIKKVELIPLKFQMEEPDAFVHPYENEPWYVQSFYRTCRMMYLSCLFLPVTLVSIVAGLTKNETIREYWLELLVKTLKNAGCTFQKFGQWLSMRPDMFPPDVIEAFAELRMDAPEHDMAHTKSEIKASFGKELDELFEHFEEKPVASGTIAQVHQARLRKEFALEGGKQDVAVKVRHPNVIWETFSDLDLVFKFVENSVSLIHMSFPFTEDDFRQCMQQQIDFNWEAYNLCKFTKYFDSDKKIQFPTISTDFLSASVLVESWMPGKPVCDWLESFGGMYKEKAETLKKEFTSTVQEQKSNLAKIVHGMAMKMFLRDNFMHGDMHGGNILMAEDGTLTVLDTGICTTIFEGSAPDFNVFLKSLVCGDVTDCTDVLLKFNTLPKDEVDIEGFRGAMQKTMNKFVSSPGTAPDGGMVDLGDLIGEILFNVQRNGVCLRSDIASSIQSMSICEGLIRMLDPKYDVCKNALPYFVRYC